MRAPSEFPTGTRLISFERICFSWDKQASRGPTWCRLDARQNTATHKSWGRNKGRRSTKNSYWTARRHGLESLVGNAPSPSRTPPDYRPWPQQQQFFTCPATPLRLSSSFIWTRISHSPHDSGDILPRVDPSPVIFFISLRSSSNSGSTQKIYLDIKPVMIITI